MKLKKSRKEKRTCSVCSSSILKGELYGERSKTILSDPKGQSFNGGRTWEPFRLTKKVSICKGCATP
tara:strand:+ start:4928 stop:5128 length:201 start_codon:yes stop_codon:yes gene_type:complete